jgi:hypothetical protein
MIYQPDIVPVANGKYILRESWSVAVKCGKRDTLIYVHAGFEYDGASVPRLLWTITGYLPDGLHRAAALAHDFLYQYHGRPPLGSVSPISAVFTRAMADKAFFDLMKKAGVGLVARWRMYAAVRAFGWLSWNRSKS